MRSSRRLALTTGALAVVAAGLALARSQVAARVDDRQAVERLIPPEQAATWTVAAFTLARRGEMPLLYGRQAGRWRCFSRGGALVAEGEAEELIQALLDAQYSPRAAVADPAHYGLAGVPELRLELHGPAVGSRPDRDVLFTVDAGRWLEGRGTTFVRLPGRDDVLALELDLVERLEPPAGRPPLLEDRLVPSDWVGAAQGIANVRVERADGQGLELTLESSPVGPVAGDSPRWRVVPQGGGPARPAEDGLAGLYVTFLLRAPFDALVDPTEVDPALAERPAARLRLIPAGAGEPLELLLLPPLADGRRVVLQSKDRLVLGIEPELADILAAMPDQLMDITKTPPWDRWLRFELLPPTPR